MNDMNTMNKVTFASLALLLCISCNERHTMEGLDPKYVFAEIANPVQSDVETRSLDAEFAFHFDAEDRITVFPSAGDECMTYHLTPSKGAGNRAYFIVESFSLKDGRYFSVYPAINGYSDPEKVILPFDGQRQTENGSTTHLAAYDYCHAVTDISDNSGCFAFKHKVSWINILIPAGNQSGCFSKVSLSSESGIASTMTVNARTGSVSLTGRVKSVDLDLGEGDGIEVSASDTLVAYLTVPADTYQGLTLSTCSKDGNVLSYSFSETYRLEEGCYYLMDVTKTEMKPLENVEGFGLYRCHNGGMVHSWEPAILEYREKIDQMSWYNGKDCTTFEFFELGTKHFASFTASSATLEEGTTCKMTIYSDEKIICRDSDFKVVRNNGTGVWLINESENLGCIIKTGE